MSRISLRLPDSLHERPREMAAHDAVSINQLITTALAEKRAALQAEEYLAARASRGTRAAFERVLRKVKKRRPAKGYSLDSED
ncbi:MAG: toxin-antitoxin system HicB family antitoxin [Gemmatimonadaceae bacterium]